MPAWDGNYSRDMFPASRRKQYVRARGQQGTEVADADYNDNTDLGYEKLRTFIEKLGGDAFFFGDAFKVVADGSDNDVEFSPGSGFITGHEAYQGLAARYVSLGAAQEDLNLHSVSTSLSATVLTDTSMNWAVNELVGRELFPDVTDGTSFTVLSNTATTITTLGDMTTVGTAGDSYYVAMSTPSGGNRTDTVWLNLYLDEISADEDSYLFHNLGSGIELDRRIKARTIIMVEQGTSAYTNYTDLDGLDHYLVKLATIARTNGVDAINPGDVTDDRNTTTSAGGTVVVSGGDTTGGSLTDKLAAGSGITFTILNPGGDEQLEISAPGSTTDEKSGVTAADTTPGYLDDKVTVTSPLTKSVVNPGADEDLLLSLSNPNDGTYFLSGTNPPTWALPSGGGSRIVPVSSANRLILDTTGGGPAAPGDLGSFGFDASFIEPRPPGATHAIVRIQGRIGMWYVYLYTIHIYLGPYTPLSGSPSRPYAIFSPEFKVDALDKTGDAGYFTRKEEFNGVALIELPPIPPVGGDVTVWFELIQNDGFRRTYDRDVIITHEAYLV